VLVKHFKLMPSHEDFELKKLLINELVLLSRDSTVLPVSSTFVVDNLFCGLFAFAIVSFDDCL